MDVDHVKLIEVLCAIKSMGELSEPKELPKILETNY